MPLVLHDRMAQLDAISLAKGNHDANADLQMCVMELVAYVAGEPWSDHPQCACPVITNFLISWNDALPSNAERDRLLKPLIPLIVGTRSTTNVEQRRSYLALDWLIRVQMPKWLDMLPALQAHANTLRELDAIANMASTVAAGAAVNAARDAAGYAAAGAAAGAAWDAAGDAAWDATRDAARGAATVNATVNAARDAYNPHHPFYTP